MYLDFKFDASLFLDALLVQFDSVLHGCPSLHHVLLHLYEYLVSLHTNMQSQNKLEKYYNIIESSDKYLYNIHCCLIVGCFNYHIWIWGFPA